MSPRQYESTVRADAAHETRSRIVRATVDLAYARGDIEMTLDEVAERAGTTVRTVLRHFGSRDALIEAGIQLGSAEVASERQTGHDRDHNFGLLVDHYERRGEFVLSLLASEHPGARRVTASGRLFHRGWVEDVFAADLPPGGPARDALVDMLVVVTDVYAWKLLRLDRGLDAAVTVDRIRVMSESIVRSR